MQLIATPVEPVLEAVKNDTQPKARPRQNQSNWKTGE